MKDRFDSVRQNPALDRAPEFFWPHQVREPQILQVAGTVSDTVDYQHIGDAVCVQRAQQIAAYKACAARKYDHCFIASRSHLSRSIIVSADRASDHHLQRERFSSSRERQTRSSAQRSSRDELLRECARPATESRAAHLARA